MSKFITAFGETKNIKEWSEDPKCSVPYRTLRVRVARWDDMEKAISSPKSPAKPINIGDQFTRLTVKKFYKKHYNNGPGAECTCSCGTENLIVRVSSLKDGNTRSCGCLQKELLSQRFKIHGQSRKPIGKVWRTLKWTNGKMRNPGQVFEWDQFEPFHKWALENGYHKGTSIRRIDPKKTFGPDNCYVHQKKWLITNKKNSK